MATTVRSFSGAAAAAAAMYWLDPTCGRRRRARFRDRFASVAREVRHGIAVGSRDLAHRLRGVTIGVRTLFNDDAVDDSILSARVRARIGRVVAHPGALEVTAVGGRIFLRGSILAQEHRYLMRAVASVRGVRWVEDQLGVYIGSRGIPALQGGRLHEPQRFELLRERWSPATRLVTGAVGTALLAYGLRPRGMLGLFGLLTGGALLTRATANMPLARWAGVTGQSSIQIRKTLRVDAPVDQVFQLLAHYEKFPLFMHHVQHVHAHPDGRSHWIVAGPGGITLEWDAMTTRLEPNRLLAWRTVSNAAVRHAGSIRFERHNGGARLEIQLTYSPPGGTLGHGLACLFGGDPKTELDDDLLRLKSFLETGKIPRHAAARVSPQHVSMAEGTPRAGEQVVH